MNRGLMIAIIGALIFAVFVATAGLGVSKPVRVTIVAGAVTGIAWLCWLDFRRKKTQARRTAADGESRFRELSALAAAPQFELVVKARSSMILAVGSIVMGAGLLWWGPESPLFLGFISGPALLVLGALWLLRVVPEFGAPAMVISQRGFRTPLTPQISWQIVDGIFLREYKTDTEQAIPILAIRIDALSQYISQFAAYYRVRYWLSGKAGRKQIAIFLRDSDEQPQVIYRLMRMLWTKSTGRDYDWNPTFSAEYNAALQKLNESAGQMRSAQAMNEHPSQGHADLAGLMKDMESSKAIVASELGREVRKWKWFIYLMTGFAILYIGYAIVYILNIFTGRPG